MGLPTEQHGKPRSTERISCLTRKLCYRKETARCRSFRFHVRRHSLYKFKSSLASVGALDMSYRRKSRSYRKIVIQDIQGHVFWGQWKGDKGLNNRPYYIIMLASFPICFRRLSVRKPWKSTFTITPLSFDASSPRNPRNYPQEPYIAIKYRHCAKSSSLIVSIYLHSNFRGGLRKRMEFNTECEWPFNLIQGHRPRPRMQLSISHQ